MSTHFLNKGLLKTMVICWTFSNYRIVIVLHILFNIIENQPIHYAETMLPVWWDCFVWSVYIITEQVSIMIVISIPVMLRSQSPITTRNLGFLEGKHQVISFSKKLVLHFEKKIGKLQLLISLCLLITEFSTQMNKIRTYFSDHVFYFSSNKFA